MLDQTLIRMVEAMERIATALEGGAGKRVTTVNAESSTATPAESTPKKRGRKKKTADKVADAKAAEDTSPPAEEPNDSKEVEETAEAPGEDTPKLGLEDARKAITALLDALSDDKAAHDAMRTAIGAKMLEVTGTTRLGDMSKDQIHDLAVALQRMA